MATQTKFYVMVDLEHIQIKFEYKSNEIKVMLTVINFCYFDNLIKSKFKELQIDKKCLL